MSYPPLNAAFLDGSKSVSAEITEDNLKQYLFSLGSHLEFRQLSKPPGGRDPEEVIKDLPPGVVGPGAYMQAPDGEWSALPRMAGMQLHALQAFVDAFMTPDSRNKRLLLCWDTGTGKTIAAITIAQRFTHLFRSNKLLAPEERPSVIILGFTRMVIQAEMLRDPRHGLITFNELAVLKRLWQQSRGAPGGSPAARQYHGYLGTLRRTLTDRQRGGYYKFFGYKEFASQLLSVTPKGEKAGIRILDLYIRPNFEDEEAGIDEEKDQMRAFATRIAQEEKLGHIHLNNELLQQLKRGLIIADEIHNVYNVHDPNMYGVAIQFVLDAFSPEDAPRAIFMSATPMSGSPTEIIDLLNLLVPKNERGGRPLRRSDFFEGRRNQISKNALRFKPKTLENISQISAGRVSFLTVSMDQPDSKKLGEDDLFPRRVFIGEPIPAYSGLFRNDKLPYLKGVLCPLAPKHLEGLREWWEQKEDRHHVLPNSAEYALYDMVFPSPPSEDSPADFSYTSSQHQSIYSAISRADPTWRLKNKIEVLKESAVAGKNNVLGGDFLRLGSLENFSGKYARYVSDVHQIIKDGPGKILTYHDRVQLTGVSLLAEVLRHNGMIELGEPVTANTMCSVCGRLQGTHGKNSGKVSHRFTPARFAAVSGSMDISQRERVMSLYNHPTNDDGHEIRMLVGSQIIIEALSFHSVQYESILSVPRDISGLIQILGRARRRESHLRLPVERREVVVRFYLNAPDKRSLPPDLVKLTRLMREFLLIQEEMTAIRRPGINGFLAQSAVLANQEPSLTGLPFKLPVTAEMMKKAPVVDDSYYAYGSAELEIQRVKDAARALLYRRPIWSEEELIQTLSTPGAIVNMTTDPSFLRRDLVLLALDYLVRASEAPTARSATTDKQYISANLQRRDGFGVVCMAEYEGVRYYYSAPLDPRGRPVRDVECYMRTTKPPRPARVNLREYVAEHLEASNFQLKLEDLLEELEVSTATNVLVNYSAGFQYSLLEKIVKDLAKGVTLHPVLKAILQVYEKFQVVITKTQLQKASGFKELTAKAGSASKSNIIGYRHQDAGRIYIGKKRIATLAASATTNEWQSIPLSAVDVTPMRPENSLVVGYTEQKGTVRFKVREPLQVLAKKQVKDIRSLARGAVCETRSRTVQLGYARSLTNLPMAELRKKSSPILCQLIQSALLQEELAARRVRAGSHPKPKNALRWFYLFNETVPSAQMGSN